MSFLSFGFFSNILMFLSKVPFFSIRTVSLRLKIPFVLVLLAVSVHTYAQNHARLQTHETHRKGAYFSRQAATILSPQPYWIKPDFTFTSISLRIGPDQDFTGAFIVSAQDTFLLQQDEELPQADSMKVASLVILKSPIDSILFYPGQIHGNVLFSFMNAATGKQGQFIQRKNQQKEDTPEAGACTEPALIEQAEWREGLPAPDYHRLYTQVKHVIIHHSAGSNTSTNYVYIIRNIYLYHTQDHGWSDIGYNYLIAQDGTIFEGRSPGGQQIERDNIQGAHFCGQNSETMGICVLGNYNTAIPTEATLNSLVRLTAWKLNKEGLDPMAQIPHPANPDLGVIAGHRDGCATECPGDHLYAELENIRLRVQQEMLQACQTEQLAVVYPVPTTDMLQVRVPDINATYEIYLYNIQGQQVEAPTYKDQGKWVIDTRLLADGVYIVKVQGHDFSEKQKIILLHSS